MNREEGVRGAGSGGHVYDFPKIIETLRTYQPNTIVFADTALFEYGDARWVGTERLAYPSCDCTGLMTHFDRSCMRKRLREELVWSINSISVRA